MGDLGSILGSGRSPEEGYDYLLQYCCLENSMDRGAWWAIVHGVTESDTTKQLIFTFRLRISPSKGLTSLLANWITDIKVFYFSELHFSSLSRWDILENTKVPGTLATYK